MRTRIDIASCGAAPWSPFNISWSRGVSVSIKAGPGGASSSPAHDYNPRMRRTLFMLACFVGLAALPSAQRGGPQSTPQEITILKPARVFDGDGMHEGWAVRVRGDRIEAVGASVDAAGATKTIDLPGTTLTPG